MKDSSNTLYVASNKHSITLIDSADVLKNVKPIILIEEKNRISENEINWFSSVVIPVSIAVITAIISYIVNKRKTDAEIESLRSAKIKTDAEIESLKKSFQPIVIGTLQSVQDKIMPSKIEALNILIKSRNRFIYHKQFFFEDDPVVPGENEFLRLVFNDYSEDKYNSFKDWFDNYSYFFPDNVFTTLSKLKDKLLALNESKKYFDSVCDQDDYPTKNDTKMILEIISIYEKAILAIRKDCHFDTSFIHDFIEQNK